MTTYDSFDEIDLTSCDCLKIEFDKWYNSLPIGYTIERFHTYFVNFGDDSCKDLVVYSDVIYFDEKSIAHYKSFCEHAKICPYCGKPFKWKGKYKYQQGYLF